jgi:hypothetical protein
MKKPSRNTSNVGRMAHVTERDQNRSVQKTFDWFRWTGNRY